MSEKADTLLRKVFEDLVDHGSIRLPTKTAIIETYVDAPERLQRISHREHARSRLSERYGIGITNNEYEQLCEALSERLTSSGHGGDGVRILCTHRTRNVMAVVDTKKRVIKTFLPLESAGEEASAE